MHTFGLFLLTSLYYCIIRVYELVQCLHALTISSMQNKEIEPENMLLEKSNHRALKINYGIEPSMQFELISIPK